VSFRFDGLAVVNVSQRKLSNLRNKGQYQLSSEKHIIMIINYTEKVGFFPCQ